MGPSRVIRQLAAACHPGPTVAVTGLAGALGRVAGLRGRRLGALIGTVGTGQLTIGWSNDLIDRQRDLAVGRADKPLATGSVRVGEVITALAGAGAACGALSLRCGARAGLVHGVLVVGSGWAYNLGLKRTRASFVPYAVAFGALPQVPTLCQDPPRTAPPSQSLAGALLGVAAHLLNALPDLDDDRRTGVHGLPHRISPAGLRASAAALLGAAGAAALATARLPVAGQTAAVTTLAGLGAGVVRGQGKVPFACAVGSAALDVAALVAAGRRETPHDHAA